MDLNDVGFVEFIKFIEDDKKINLKNSSFYLISFDVLQDLKCLNIYFKKVDIVCKFCKKDRNILFFIFNKDEWKYIGEYSFASGVASTLFENKIVNNIEATKIERILREFILFKF